METTTQQALTPREQSAFWLGFVSQALRDVLADPSPGGLATAADLLATYDTWKAEDDRLRLDGAA